MSQTLKRGRRATGETAQQRARRQRHPKGRAAHRRQQRDRLVTLGVPAVVVGAIVVTGVVLSLGRSGGGTGTLPKGPVRAGGPALSQPLVAGSAVPDFSAPGLTGGQVAWRDYRGSPAVLVAWAPWCPHCQTELPVLSRVAAQFPSVNLVTVVTAVGLHPGPTPQQYMSEHGLSFPVAVDDSIGSIAAGLGIQGFPTVYYVDSSGTVNEVTVGEVPEPQMRDSFSALALP